MIRLLWASSRALASDSELRDGRLPDRDLRADVGDELWNLVISMVAPSVQNRPQQMAFIAASLTEYRDPAAVYDLLRQCRAKGLIEGTSGEAAPGPREMPGSEGEFARRPFVGAGEPPVIGGDSGPSLRLRGGVLPWLLVGLAVCFFGVVIAAVGLGIQLANLRRESGTSLATDVRTSSGLDTVDDSQSDETADRSDVGEEQVVTPRADFGQRPNINRPVRGDQVLRLQGSVLEIEDTGYLFSRREDFTVEVWLRQESSGLAGPGGVVLMSAESNQLGLNPVGSGWSLGIDTLGLGPSWSLEVGGRNIGRVGPLQEARFLPNHWHHLAVCHSGGTWTIWLDGERELSTSSSPIDRGGQSGNLRIGGSSFRTPVNGFRGLVGGVRVSEGVIYDAAFEPKFPLEVQESTISLIDGTSEALEGGRLRDHSPHAHDAGMGGSELWVIP
ncbi:MAG: LamG domain-containing protein [Pirellulaceae bacterium]